MSYIKIVDEAKRCDVFLNENPDEKQIGDLTRQGFIKADYERGYDGFCYLAGYAPERPDDIKKSEIRAVRNQYLADTDKFMIADFPITEEVRSQYRAYRQYLRDYTKTDGWFNAAPTTFEEWKQEPDLEQIVANGD